MRMPADLWSCMTSQTEKLNFELLTFEWPDRAVHAHVVALFDRQIVHVILVGVNPLLDFQRRPTVVVNHVRDIRVGYLQQYTQTNILQCKFIYNVSSDLAIKLAMSKPCHRETFEIFFAHLEHVFHDFLKDLFEELFQKIFHLVMEFLK